MTILMALCLTLQIPKYQAITFQEKVEVIVHGEGSQSFFNTYWIDRNRLRTDRNQGQLSLIYDLGFHVLYVIDHESESYEIVRPSLDKKDTRLNLLGIASIRNGTLQATGPIAIPTGRKKKIGPWNCDEYQLSYPENFGVDTRIWSVNHRMVKKSFFKKVWHAALGTSPPGDVKVVLSKILKEIRGIPIQVQSTATYEDMETTIISTITSLSEFERDDGQTMSIPNHYIIKRD